MLGTLCSAAAIAYGASRALGAIVAGRKRLFRTSLALGAVFSCSDTVSTLQVGGRAGGRAAAGRRAVVHTGLACGSVQQNLRQRQSSEGTLALGVAPP